MKTSVLKFGMEHKGFLAACCRKWEKYKADRIERKFLKENPRRLSRQDSEEYTGEEEIERDDPRLILFLIDRNCSVPSQWLLNGYVRATELK